MDVTPSVDADVIHPCCLWVLRLFEIPLKEELSKLNSGEGRLASHWLHNVKKNTGAPRWQSSFSSTLTVRLIQIGQTALPGCNLLGLYCHLVGRRDNTQRPCLDCLKFPFTYTVPSRLTHSCVVQITQWYKPEILFVLTLSFWSPVFVVTVLLNFNYMLHNALFLRLQNKFQIKNGFILCPSL